MLYYNKNPYGGAAARTHLVMQLRKQLALEAERQIEVEKTEETDSGVALMVPYWCTTDEPLHLINILKAYSDLGFHPSHALLTAAEPFLSSVRSPIPLKQTLDLISLFGSFSWQPGQFCVTLLFEWSWYGSPCWNHLSWRG